MIRPSSVRTISFSVALLLAACSGSTSHAGSAATSGTGAVQSTGGSSGAPGGGGRLATGGVGGRATTTASGGQGGAAGGGGQSGGGGGSSNATGRSTAATLAMKLRGHTHFLVGMGNDLDNNHDQDGAYTLGVTLDLHDAYLVGLQGEGGWPDWNAGGTFVDILCDAANRHGVTPMFTLYQMAAHGEGNLGALTDDSYMKPFWQGAKLLFQRLAKFDKPAVVQLEPDFWGFCEQQSSGNATKIAVHVTSLASECAGLQDDLSGMGKCLVKLARQIAPKTAVGFHASAWGGSPQAVADFLSAVGGRDADFVAIDPLDRDAGCFEAHTDSGCQRNDGPWYWDESNASSPNFHEHLAFMKTVSSTLAVPALWWQVPFGVPSSTPGGSSGHYRDNRVHYLFSHVDEFVAAGGVGSVFGVGAGNQTYITTDGDQFKNAVTKYLAAPTPLP